MCSSDLTMGSKSYLYALLVATVGDRALGIEAAQLAATARWATENFHAKPALQTDGPRSGIVALVAAAVEPDALGPWKPAHELASLHEIIANNWAVGDKPELFCFGLLESFDVPQLKALADTPH